MDLVQTLSLNASPDDFYRVGDCCRNDPTDDASQHFVHFSFLELLVKHVVEPCEKSFLHAGCHGPTEETHGSLLLVNARGCSHQAFILVEIWHFVACFDNVERVGKESADYPSR